MSETAGAAFWLAVWGAVISTLLAILRGIEFFRDRICIQVRVVGGLSSNKGDPNSTWLKLTVANTGKRPVTIAAAALQCPKGHVHSAYAFADSVGPSAPYLTEGKFHYYIMLEDGLGFGPDRYVGFVEEGTGRRHYSHSYLVRRWKLRHLRAHRSRDGQTTNDKSAQ